MSEKIEIAPEGSSQCENLTQRELVGPFSNVVIDHEPGDDTGTEDLKADDQELEVTLSEDEINRLRSHWASSSLILQQHGKGFRYQSFVSRLKETLRPAGEMKCSALGCGFFLINLALEKDLVRVSKGAPWFIGDTTVLTVRKWQPNFKPSKADSLALIPIWVRLPELPIEYYNEPLLEKVGNRIGHFLRIDSKTAKCEQARYARMFIIVDRQKPLPQSIKIGPLIKQSIQYEGLHLVCTTCGIRGHEAEACQHALRKQSLKQSSPAKPNLQRPPSLSASALQDKYCPEESEPIQEEMEKLPTPSLPQPMPPPLGIPQWKYEVFVSFRGEDTRKGFASHLFHALEKADICHYRDSDGGERGLMIKPMLLDAIQHSKSAVVLFSTNFAASRWCLDEVLEIMNCNDKYEDHGHIVFPIFYNVEPSDVRALRGAFGNGYWRCVEQHGDPQKAVEWRDALGRAGNLSGWNLQNEDESTLIKKILATIRNRVYFDHALYGGDAGNPYNDNKYTDIRKITVVVASSLIEAIRIEYDQNGSLVRPRSYGGAREGQSIKVRLNYPKEYLTAVSGHIRGNKSNGVIHSLLFESNERVYGPYGKRKGRPFSINATTGEKIVGIFGKHGSRLSSIGAHCQPVSSLFISVGPFGSNNHINWDDGKHQGIRQIEVEFDSMIRSISILYDNYGHPLGPFRHQNGSTSTESKTNLVKLDLEYPYEYLTSISGYTREIFGVVTLQSLTLHTNMKSYGPFGAQVGNHFSQNRIGIKIVGFYGRYSNGYLESVGAYAEPVSEIHPLKSIGPFGGDTGDAWYDGKHTDLRQITVNWDSYCIRSVQFVYEHEGQLVEAPSHGGDGDDRNTCTVDLDPDEYIVRVSGYYDRCELTGNEGVSLLTFESNKRTLGPYGNPGGTYFLSPLSLGKIVGFHGRSGEHLISIGSYYAPIFHTHPLKTIGPFGSDVGESWDDGRYTGIRQIEISYGLIIDGICCVYDDNGEQSFRSSYHGGRGGSLYKVELDYPNEYIVSMCGHVGRFGNIVIESLTLRTNYGKTHGPLGTEEGIPFSFASNIGKIIGFFGQSKRFLNSIGAHVEVLTCS